MPEEGSPARIKAPAGLSMKPHFIMHKYLVSVYKWENPCLNGSEADLSKGDLVVVETDFGTDLGRVESERVNTDESPARHILRKATKRDIKTAEGFGEKRKAVIENCRKESRRLNLEMKVIDVRFSLDGSNVVVFFTSDGRIDFRELVKNLSKTFHRSIRMQQIGSREEARRLGGCGICGRELCCVRFSGNLPSISTDMARIQQVAHRGSERISGLCGRLMCCLAYEAEQYRDLLKGMPELHSKVKSKEGKGEVIELNALSQEVRVRLENDKIITLKREELI